MQIRQVSGAGGAHVSGFGRPLILMGPADGGGGGGGGGSGGQGGQQGGQGQGGAGAGEGGEQGALTDVQKKEVGDMVNAAVNGAITNHLTRFKKQVTEDLTATLNGALGPIGEQLKALAERAPAAAGKPKEGELPESVRAEMLRQEQRIKELEAGNKAEKEAREAERATRLREEERTSLAAALRAKGIQDPQIKAAVAVLHTEEKRVVFKFERGTGNAKYVDEMDLDKGVDEWLKTDEGKGYVPARPAQGAGGGPARQGPAARPGSTEAKQQATADLAKILLQG